MPCLPNDIQGYFQGLESGLMPLLPIYRVENRDFLLNLYEVLQIEPQFTSHDKIHLMLIMKMAEQVKIPPIENVKTYTQAEVFLMQACPRFSRKSIRYAMEWAFLLLARHGRIEADLPQLRVWLMTWRRVQTLNTLDQLFVSQFIQWLTIKSFAPRSILDLVREYNKFSDWMNDHDLTSFEQIRNTEIQRYLLDRACGQSTTSKKRLLGLLKTILNYYKEALNGGFCMPNVSVNVPNTFGICKVADPNSISILWAALETRTLPVTAGMMLTLILGYGLQLKTLPLLRLTKEAGVLQWTERLPSRCGIRERQVRLHLTIPWLIELWGQYLNERNATSQYPFFFTSGYALRRNKSVSVDSCQRVVQSAVATILGYPITVNQLERSCLKELASVVPLTEFMMRTSSLSKSRLGRMLIWMSI